MIVIFSSSVALSRLAIFSCVGGASGVILTAILLHSFIKASASTSVVFVSLLMQGRAAFCPHTNSEKDAKHLRLVKQSNGVSKEN